MVEMLVSPERFLSQASLDGGRFFSSPVQHPGGRCTVYGELTLTRHECKCTPVGGYNGLLLDMEGSKDTEE